MPIPKKSIRLKSIRLEKIKTYKAEASEPASEVELKSIRLEKIKTYPLSKRVSKVKINDFAKVCGKGSGFGLFLDSLPNILAAREFRGLVESIIKARSKNKPVISMMGAHVIKCGLSPIIIDLIKRRIITAIAMNGAGIIHDLEIALIGQTSEDVASAIEKGRFGMARETAELINGAIKAGAGRDIGIGEAIGRSIAKEKAPYKNLSLAFAGIKYNVPITVHVGIGTDTVHQHPSCDGEALGKASLKDFHIFVGEVAKLGGGGVIVNIGSAVILPEVFLKALNLARNLGYKVKDFTTANLDMIPHYRPYQNVVRRPTSGAGKGYSIVGHHEIMIPLLARAILEGL